jgi:hypothetical protein
MNPLRTRLNIRAKDGDSKSIIGPGDDAVMIQLFEVKLSLNQPLGSGKRLQSLIWEVIIHLH